jgi:HK97 family phage portal protein
MKQRTTLVGHGGVKSVYLDGNLDAASWDAIFGAGSADAVANRRGAAMPPEAAWARQGWLRKCVDLRAKAVSTLPWAIYRQGAENAEDPLWKDDDVSTPKEFAPLDGIELALYLAEASLALTGAAYFGKTMVEPGTRIQGSRLMRFAGLQFYNPLTITPEITLDGGLLYFRRSMGSQQVNVIPEAMLWAWQPSPFVEVGPGQSDAASAAVNAATLDALARFMARHLDSGLVKMTVLSIEGHSNAEQRSTLKSIWTRLMRRGVDEAGEIPVLSDKVTPHTIGEGLKDVSSEEITQEHRQAIATAFGIPFSLLQGDAANFATAQVDERGFYTRTVIPQAKIIERAINKHLLNGYGYTLVFEPHRADVMMQYELEKAKALALACGGAVLTRNEGRELMGYDPVEGYDAPVEPPQPSGDGQRLPVPQLRAHDLADRVAKIVATGT